MRIALGVVAALLVMVAGTAVATIPDQLDSDIQELCRHQWPHDEYMASECFDDQIEANANLGRLQRRTEKGSRDRRILNRCVKKWTAPLLTNWVMALSCAGDQKGATNELDALAAKGAEEKRIVESCSEIWAPEDDENWSLAWSCAKQLNESRRAIARRRAGAGSTEIERIESCVARFAPGWPNWDEALRCIDSANP